MAQSYLTLCDPVDCSTPGSSVHGILKARIVEWIAMSSSRESSWPRVWTHVSHLAGRFFTTESAGKLKAALWSIHFWCWGAQLLSRVQLCDPIDYSCQAPLPMEFTRQEYWNWLPFPSPGDFPDPLIKPASLALASRFFTSEPPGKFLMFEACLK